LGVNPFFIKDYAMAANNYPPKKISEIFMILEDFDMRSKGVNNNSSPQGELLKEMVFKIMH
jgi:DNA polymerase III subunit delta